MHNHTCNVHHDINPDVRIAADDVSKLLKEVGVAPEKEALDNLIKAVKGKKLHELVVAG